jgi:hypothetical protein
MAVASVVVALFPAGALVATIRLGSMVALGRGSTEDARGCAADAVSGVEHERNLHSLGLVLTRV